MSMSDPIADMLTRLRNAGKAKLPQVTMLSSKMKIAIVEVLKAQGFIDSYTVTGEVIKELTIKLKYKGKAIEPVIEALKRVSKPSCRIYVSSDNIPRALGGLGIAILSTSQGVITDRQARSRNIGGEVLCYVW